MTDEKMSGVTFEVKRFANGELMLVTRLKKSRNVRIDNEEVSWVPSYDEMELQQEAVKAIDDYNMKKRSKGS